MDEQRYTQAQMGISRRNSHTHHLCYFVKNDEFHITVRYYVCSPFEL